MERGPILNFNEKLISLPFLVPSNNPIECERPMHVLYLVSRTQPNSQKAHLTDFFFPNETHYIATCCGIACMFALFRRLFVFASVNTKQV